MSYIDMIKERARLDKKTIVLPESNDKRTLLAAARIVEEGRQLQQQQFLRRDPGGAADLQGGAHGLIRIRQDNGGKLRRVVGTKGLVGGRGGAETQATLLHRFILAPWPLTRSRRSADLAPDPGMPKGGPPKAARPLAYRMVSAVKRPQARRRANAHRGTPCQP